MNGFNRITLVIWFIFIIESVVSIYDPSIETKTKVLHHDPLLRIPRSSGVQIHDQYSRVQMYKPEYSERHFGRSDASQREGRTFNSEEENDVVPHGTECPPGQTGQFPYLMDCRQYLNCWKGRGYIQSCSPGTLFNPETFECDHPSKVVCASMDKPRSDINVRFTKTSARLTDTQPRQYNNNRPYNFESNENPVCPSGESGLFPHPFDCTKFLNCANGITHIQDCGPGTAFNPNIKNCDWPQNVDCESRNSAQQNEYTGEGTIEARNIDEIFQGSATKNIVNNREHRVNDGLTWNEQTRSWHSVGSTYPSQVLEPPTREIRPIYTRPGSITQPDIRRSDTVENNEDLLLRSGSNREDDNQKENDDDFYSNRRTVQENRPYNREYFKPSQQTPNVPSKPTEMAPLPISEAIKALLRPYYNRNDNKSEPNSEAIKTRLGLTSSEVVVPNKKNDMELILSGEQESLAKNDDSDKYRNKYDDEGVTEISFTTTERSNVNHGYHKQGYNPSINQHSVPPGHDPNHPFHRNHFNNQQAEVLPGHDTNHPFHRHNENSGAPPGHDPNHPYHRPNNQHHQNSGVPPGHDPNHPYHRNHQTSGGPHDSNHRTNHQNSGVPPGHDPNHPYHRPNNQHHQNSGVPPGEDLNHPYHRNRENSGVPPGHDPNHPFHRNHQNSGVPPGHDPNHPFHRQGTNGHQGHHPPGYPLNQQGNSHVPPGHNPDHPYHRKHHHNNRHENEQNCTDSRHFISTNPQETTTRHHLSPFEENTQTNFGFIPRRDTFHETTIRPRGTSSPRTTPKIIIPFTTHRTLTNQEPDFPEFTTPTPRGNPINVLPLYPTYPNPTEDNPCDGMFKCSYNKCISFDKVCDGRSDCDDRRDETNCPAIGYEARLSSENGNKHEGRVEIKVYNQWGYICDDKFGMRDATVLCKELGYELGASEVRPNSFYGPNKEFQTANKTLFIMDELDCLGNETSLQECQFNGWGVHDCNSEEIVGVVCKIPVMTCPPNYWLCETSQECIPIAFLCDNVLDCGDHTDENENHCKAKPHLRLTGGTSDSEGRVEIKYHGLWGTICDDDFGDKEASVICRNLGYGGASTVMKSLFGPGDGPIWLDQVSCSGNETNIEDCVHWHWGEHNCAHTEDVGVRCSDGPVVVKPPARRPSGIKSSNRLEPYVSVEQEVVFYQNERRAGRLLPEQCGQVKVNNLNDDQEPQFRVIKGTTAKKGAHPWQATIRVKGQGKSSHWCGAVLISKFHLLTAAHCLIGFPKGAYFIRLGDHHSEIEEPSEVEVFIENLYIHEDFRKGQHMNNDLAIIVLKSPVRFNDYIQPICMPTIDAAYTAGMNCTISGWGSVQSGVSTPSLDLRAAPIPILEDNVCKQPQVYGNVITDGMFCAGSLDEGIDACDGDSGGPLVCINDGGSHTLYGIISWGQHCGFANKPGVYVKIAKYIDWIKEKLNDSMINYGV